MNLIHGPQTDGAIVRRMMAQVEQQRPAAAVIVNHRKDGAPFANFLRVFPLSSDGAVTHFMGVLEQVNPALPSPPSTDRIDEFEAGDKAGYLSKDDATLAPDSPSFSYWPSIVAGEPATSEIADGEGGGARFASDRRADSDDALVASGP